jgi:LysM repeat protein
MNAPKRTSAKAIGMAVNLVLLIPLLTGCNPQKAAKDNHAEPAASQSSLPPITPSQADLTPTPAAEPTNAVAANVLPAPTVTNPSAVTPPTTAPEGGKDYTVAKGDTLYKIARTNKVKVSALTKANPSVDFAKIKAGQKIKIPAASTASAAPSGIGLREPSADAGNVHVVKAGETLTQLAKLNHTTIKAIQDANGLKTTRVNVGQKIKIPTGTSAAPAATPKSTNTAKPAETT